MRFFNVILIYPAVNSKIKLFPQFHQWRAFHSQSLREAIPYKCRSYETSDHNNDNIPTILTVTGPSNVHSESVYNLSLPALLVIEKSVAYNKISSTIKMWNRSSLAMRTTTKRIIFLIPHNKIYQYNKNMAFLSLHNYKYELTLDTFFICCFLSN